MLVDFLSDQIFMPHIHCYLGNSALVWTMFITDLMIGMAYVGISLTLWALIRKINIAFNFIVVCFGVFILACGLTHFMEVYTLWHPVYWISATVKAITALASVGTGIYLYRMRHALYAIAEAAKLSENRRILLEQLNADLNERSEELAKSNLALADQQKALAHSAKMSALGEMAGGIAHEINSPLAIITLHANQIERFQKRGKLTEELILQETKLIADTAKRIGDIIKSLRSFAREADKDPFFKVSVASIVNDALVLCQSRFKSNGVALTVEIEKPETEVECRSVQITQVILNLLNNAFDAALTQEAAWVRLDVSYTDSEVLFRITDSGNGVPNQVQEKLFQPFFTTKEVGKGTGLGLSISKGIAASHSGNLILDRGSENTSFILQLPLVHHSEAGIGGQL